MGNDYRFTPDQLPILASVLNVNAPGLTFIVDPETGECEEAWDFVRALGIDQKRCGRLIEPHQVAAARVLLRDYDSHPDWSFMDVSGDFKAEAESGGAWCDVEWTDIILPPEKLFSIVWPGGRSVDEYYIVRVPTAEEIAVIARFDSDLHGYSEAVIGVFGTEEDLVEAIGDIIREWWWSHWNWEVQGWVSYGGGGSDAAGQALVDEATARAWRADVWGTKE